MRSIFLKPNEEFSEGEVFVLADERSRHLIKSVRIKENEKILLFDGRGNRYTGVIDSIEKKTINIKIISKAKTEKSGFLDLFIGLVKKDALEDIIRMSVELGLSKLFPLETQYSQRYGIDGDRLERIQESAIIQSNNPYKVQLKDISSLRNLKSEMDSYDHIFYFSSIGSTIEKPIRAAKKVGIIIGPEGGFSQDEEVFLRELQNISIVHLSVPIMRAPTALCVATGYLYSKLTR